MTDTDEPTPKRRAPRAKAPAPSAGPPTESTPASTDDASYVPGGQAPADRRSTVLVLAVSLAVLFGIVAAVLGVVAVSNGGGDGTPLASLRRAAGTAAEAFFTYDYENPEAHKERMLELSTGSFRSEYEDAFDEGLGELITRVKATSEGFVKDVYVSEIDEERAQAVVVSDVTRNGVGGPRTVADVYILLSFVRVDGEWRVDDLTDLNFDEVGAGTGGVETSSTTVP